MAWIYLFAFFLSEAWSVDPGTNDYISVNPTTTPPLSNVHVNRKEVGNIGTNVNLTCGNKTWNETMYVIWKIKLKHNHMCRISFNNDGRSENSCNDGKSLQNNSRGQSYLHIPKFSRDDVGVYKCESVFTGGNKNFIINVTITVPPDTSAWLERKNNINVAVCRAKGGNPAANISWSHPGKHERVSEMIEPDGSVTVESHLELPEKMNPENLSCIIRHQFWEQEKTLVPSEKAAPWLWPFFIIGVVLIAFMVGLILFALKKPIMRSCQQTQPSSSKPPVPEDVEEVEPYASYVQRVNSIYN